MNCGRNSLNLSPTVVLTLRLKLQDLPLSQMDLVSEIPLTLEPLLPALLSGRKTEMSGMKRRRGPKKWLRELIK